MSEKTTIGEKSLLLHNLSSDVDIDLNIDDFKDVDIKENINQNIIDGFIITEDESNIDLNKLYQFNVNDLPQLIEKDLIFKHHFFEALRDKNDPYIYYMFLRIVKNANMYTIEWLEKYYPRLIGKMNNPPTVMQQPYMRFLKRAAKEKNYPLFKWSIRLGYQLLTYDQNNTFQQFYNLVCNILLQAMIDKEHKWFEQIFTVMQMYKNYQNCCILKAIEIECCECLEIILKTNQFFIENKLNVSPIDSKFVTMAAKTGNISLCIIFYKYNIKHSYTIFTVKHPVTRDWIKAHYTRTITNVIALCATKVYKTIFNNNTNIKIKRNHIALYKINI